MTVNFGLNENNDLYVGSNGNLVFLSGLEAVITACETVSKAQLGEMIFATTQGIPNFQTVWVGVPNLGLWQSYLRIALQNVEGVVSVKDLSLRAAGGKLSYVATIETQFGLTEISG